MSELIFNSLDSQVWEKIRFWMLICAYNPSCGHTPLLMKNASCQAESHLSFEELSGSAEEYQPRCRCYRITVYRMCICICMQDVSDVTLSLQSGRCIFPFLVIASCIWSYIGTDFKLLILWKLYWSILLDGKIVLKLDANIARIGNAVQCHN